MTNRAKNNIRKSLWLCLIAATGFYIMPVSVFSETSHAQASLSGTLDPKSFYDSENLQAFYEQRGMKPVWIRGVSEFQPRVDAVIGILESAWTHGLNPAQYRITEIKDQMKSLNADNRLATDLIISDAVIRYSRDLTGMRGQNKSADSKITYWREPLNTAQILEMVSDAANPIEKLRALEPSHNLYQALRTELVRLTAEPSDADFKPIKISGPLKPEKSYPQIPAIRARFGLPPAAKEIENTYDEALAVEVLKLQRAYGFDTNGVIAGRTLAQINMTNEAKIWQILANMERLRWISPGRPDKYVLVNIPSATLWAVEKGETKLEMPVIIGKTARPTYSFKTEITGVRFNPNWTVPPTIKNKDFLPMLQQNPQAFIERGIQIQYNGQIIDPSKVDWSTVTTKHLSQVKMVQNPGDDNPLGKVRVIMENPYNIYLHDTNHREMFDKDERALSSGCIRVSQPEKLADFILSSNDKWSWNGMEKMIDSGRMRDVATKESLPVFITYQTVWLDSEGRLVYGTDVYGQDAKLSKMLKKSGSVHLPQASGKAAISL
jgi:L,D-transpeptidase YcbB